MLAHGVKFVFRIIYKNRGVYLLNVFGLAIGLCISIVLGSYYIYESDFDSFHVNEKKIYQLWASVQFGPKEELISRFSAGTGEAIRDNYPGVEAYVRIKRIGPVSINCGDGAIRTEENLIFADAALFDIFTFPVVSGNITLLNQPGTVAISETTSRKYFGSVNAAGKIITLNDSLNLQVLGVFKDMPVNSSMQFDVVVSMVSLQNLSEYRRDFDNHQVGLGTYQTFFLLADASVPARLEDEIPKLKETFIINGYHFERLSGAHLRNYGGSQTTSIAYLFLVVAILSYVISLFNSVNMIVAKGIERSNEIIIRRINGANRLSIVGLFYLESFLLTLFSFVLAFALAVIFVSTLREILTANFDASMFVYGPFLTILFLSVLAMTAATGLYPALLLSGNKPVFSLTSKFSRDVFSRTVRKFLLTLQFAVSAILVLGIIVFEQQLSYLNNLDMGVDIRDVVVFKLDPSGGGTYGPLKNKILSQSGVTSVGASTISLFAEPPPAFMASRSDSTNPVALSQILVDEAFLKTLKLKWVHQPATDKGMILNETAVNSLSLLGKSVASQVRVGKKVFDVTGVMKDFNYTDLREKVGNLSLSIIDDSSKVFAFTGCYVYVRFENGLDVQQVVSSLGQVYKTFNFPGPFEYSLLVDTFNRSYEKDRAMKSSITFFAGFTIVIASFGLIGLLMIDIAGRMKDLSIRKVLGAGYGKLTFFLLKEVVIILIVSLVLSFPVAVYFLNKWLNTFAYHTEVYISDFALCIAFICFVTLAVSFVLVQRAVRMNPIQFLRKD